jgi:hypothetical protein
MSPRSSANPIVSPPTSRVSSQPNPCGEPGELRLEQALLDSEVHEPGQRAARQEPR